MGGGGSTMNKKRQDFVKSIKGMFPVQGPSYTEQQVLAFVSESTKELAKSRLISNASNSRFKDPN